MKELSVIEVCDTLLENARVSKAGRDFAREVHAAIKGLREFGILTDDQVLRIIQVCTNYGEDKARRQTEHRRRCPYCGATDHRVFHALGMEILECPKAPRDRPIVLPESLVKMMEKDNDS